MSLLSACPSGVAFRIFRSRSGRWCATTGDGLLGGTFFDHDAAVRFAQRESYGAPLHIIDDELTSHSGTLAARRAAPAR